MKKVIPFFLILLIIFFYPPKVHAIIFLPAIILIPVAKIVALIIGGFSIPSLGIGAMVTKLFGSSLKKTLVFVFLILILAGILLAVYLKLHNPERPWF